MNACNPSCTIPIFDDIVLQNPGLPNLFSICLTPENGGVLDLGLIDSKKYSSPLTYIPVIDERWYNIDVQDILVGGISTEGILDLSHYFLTNSSSTGVVSNYQRCHWIIF